MKKSLTTILAGIVAAGAFAADHKELYLVGEATLTGWDLGLATAIAATPDNDNIYEGTLYLKNEGDFKFLVSPQWGGTEFGGAEGAALEDGEIKLATGNNDEGYAKISVPESGNYLITVNTEELTATIVKSVYQETPIRYASLYIIGSVYEPIYGFNEAPVMYQDSEKPYIFKANDELTAGEFKICFALGGGREWRQDCFFFRDAENSEKMVPNQDGDLQWTIDETKYYTITADVLDNTLSIATAATGVTPEIVAEDETPVYYNLQGIREERPHKGVYIKKTSAGCCKVRF